MKGRLFIVCMAAFLASCSSVQSIKDPGPKDLDGLVYYLPMKDVILTVTVGDTNQPTTAAISTTSAYADRSHRYVLRQKNAMFADNDLNVGIGVNGLLSSAKAESTSRVSDVFKNLGDLVGTVSTKSNVPPPPKECSKGVHTFVFTLSALKAGETQCGVTVSAKRYDRIDQQNNKDPGASKDSEEKYSGIFYKQAIPYLVTAKAGSSLNVSEILFSPSESPVYFLPVTGTFFSNNDADFTFIDGMPTKYSQNTDGELVALLKLPADVIGAYFGAVGMIFDSFKKRDDKEVLASKAELAAEIQKRKFKDCMSALKANDTDALTKLGCDS